jgi:hypothetical protein
MADFLDKLKGTLDKGISTVNIKSKEIIGKQRIRLQLSELEAERKIALQDLGKIIHASFEASGGQDPFAVDKLSKLPESGDFILDKWDRSVLDALKLLNDGELRDKLFEDTENEFKITAKQLLDEVQKHLPESEKKGQNLQWLGRVLGKYDLAEGKFSKRINKERETVYVFDKDKTKSALGKANGAGKTKKTASKTRVAKSSGKSDARAEVLKKCKEISELGEKIAALEKKSSEIGTK